jgi:hypothetical protein
VVFILVYQNVTYSKLKRNGNTSVPSAEDLFLASAPLPLALGPSEINGQSLNFCRIVLYNRCVTDMWPEDPPLVGLTCD